MSASYPSKVKSFPTRVNYTEVIDASHPNTLQEEVVAIETTLGVNPQGAYSTVNERLLAAETTAGDALPKAGGSMTGDVNFGGTKTVTNLKTPSETTDAATKGYVDATATTSTNSGLVTSLLMSGM